MCKRKIDIKLKRFVDDLCFRKLDQRCVNAKMCAFDPGFGPKVSEGFKCRDKLRPAIRISAIINRIRSDKDVGRSNCLRQRQRVRKEDRVASGNVRDRNPASNFCFRSLFRYTDIAGQCRLAENITVDLCNAVLLGAKLPCDSSRTFDLDPVPLPVVKRKGLYFVTLRNCNRQRGR